MHLTCTCMYIVYTCTVCICSCIYWKSVYTSSSACSKEEKRPTWRHRSKSIDNVRQQMIRTYISDTGSPRTDFPDPKVSHVALWLRACLRKLGQGSLDYSLLIFHKNNKFRQKVKRAVKSKYPTNFIHVYTCIYNNYTCTCT